MIIFCQFQKLTKQQKIGSYIARESYINFQTVSMFWYVYGFAEGGMRVGFLSLISFHLLE